MQDQREDNKTLRQARRETMKSRREARRQNCGKHRQEGCLAPPPSKLPPPTCWLRRCVHGEDLGVRPGALPNTCLAAAERYTVGCGRTVATPGGEQMTKLLTQAFQRASKLPPNLQDELARELLDELQWEAHWDGTLAESGDMLDKMAEQALAEDGKGLTEEKGFDEL